MHKTNHDTNEIPHGLSLIRKQLMIPLHIFPIGELIEIFLFTFKISLFICY